MQEQSSGSPPHLWCTAVCDRWGGKQPPSDGAVVSTGLTALKSYSGFSVFPETIVLRRKLCSVEIVLQRVREGLFQLLNASFVLICVSQAIKEPGKILTLDLKCYQPQRRQHVCCQGSDQVWKLSTRLCKSWEKSRWHKSVCCGSVIDWWCPVVLSSMDNVLLPRRTQGGRWQFLQQVLGRILGRYLSMRPVVTKVEMHCSRDVDKEKLRSHYTLGAGEEIMGRWLNVEFLILLDCLFSSGIEHQPSLI